MFGPYAIAVGRGRHRHVLEERATSLGVSKIVPDTELLWVAEETATHLHSDNTLLIGQIFSGDGARLEALPDSIRQAEELDELRRVLAPYWGNFALFHATAETAFVYRDPSASVPVYRIGRDGGTIFVSDAVFAARLGLLEEAEIDSAFLVHWLQYPFLRTRRTGLDDVKELLPGMGWSSSDAASWTESSIWHPSQFTARDAAIRDPTQAASTLRELALRVVARQTPPGIVLRLSGGLDSSLIAACLAEDRGSFACINFATRSRDGDERDYARAVAEALGLELIEVREPEPAKLIVPDRLSFRPSLNPLLAPFETAIAGATSTLDAALLVDGGGGDNLFCSLSSAAPVIDALLWASLREAVRTAGDIATRAGCSLWAVAAAAARRAVRRRPPWREERSFLQKSALLKRPELHPWLDRLHVPPGKREHVEALVHVQHFLDRSPSEGERLHPLLAQPLLEHCLRIPAWHWMKGGRDRAVARDAFVGRVPASVLQRRLKGSLQSMLYRSFEQQHGAMRDLLSEGELARRRLVDPDAIRAALDSDRWMADEVQLRISEIAALELWLQSWRSQPASSSSAS